MKKNVNSDNSEVNDVYSVSSLRSDECEEGASLKDLNCSSRSYNTVNLSGGNDTDKPSGRATRASKEKRATKSVRKGLKSPSARGQAERKMATKSRRRMKSLRSPIMP
jgi:hypothetical protein